jgi:transposase InsO family protein
MTPEYRDIPDWARQEREADLVWIAENLDVFSVAATLAFEEVALKRGKPEIFNTDQGAQFTAQPFVGCLETAGVRVSMDGRGRVLDNIFVERL